MLFRFNIDFFISVLLFVLNIIRSSRFTISTSTWFTRLIIMTVVRCFFCYRLFRCFFNCLFYDNFFVVTEELRNCFTNTAKYRFFFYYRLHCFSLSRCFRFCTLRYFFNCLSWFTCFLFKCVNLLHKRLNCFVIYFWFITSEFT
ncbi:hypothetical protein MOVI109754_15285 [Moritella viscosa]